MLVVYFFQNFNSKSIFPWWVCVEMENHLNKKKNWKINKLRGIYHELPQAKKTVVYQRVYIWCMYKRLSILNTIKAKIKQVINNNLNNCGGDAKKKKKRTVKIHGKMMSWVYLTIETITKQQRRRKKNTKPKCIYWKVKKEIAVSS